MLLAALTAAFLLLPSLLYPFGRDQAVFAYVGSVMARGGMPYRDAWDLKPPGIYLAYALLASLSRDHGLGLMHLLRAADVAAAAGVGVLLAGILRRLGRPEAAATAAGWYACLYLQGGYWGLAQAESWANLFLLGGVLLALASGGGPPIRRLFLIGILGGLAAVLKFTTLLPLLPVLPYAFRRLPAGGRLRAALTLCAGIVLPLAGVAGWLAVTGVWPAYLEIQRGFVAPYTQLSASGPLAHLEHVFRYTGLWLGSVWLPAGLALAALEPSAGKRPAWGTGVALLAGGLVAVWMQDKYFGYHWQTALPALALLAALGSARVCEAARIPPRAIPAVCLLGVLFWAGGTRWGDYRDAVRVSTGSLSTSEWLARFGRPGRGDNSFLANTWVANYVRGHTRPDEAVLIWGFEPAVYLLADRRPPSRFFFNVPVSARFAPDAWRQEFLRDLEREPPELFLTVRHDAIPWASGRTDDSQAQLESWPELRNWLARGYRQEQQIEDFTLYRRVPR